jgi:ribokinase
VSRRRSTMADVARLAGVSIGTVSNVLNGTAKIRPKTREKVEAAIRDLSFRPNVLARSLTMKSRPAAARSVALDTPRLIVAGHVSVDYTAMLSVLPHRSDRVTGRSIEKSLGGPAANTAVFAAALGDRFPLAVELISAIGDDADSDWALSELTLKNVDTIAIRRQPGQRLARCIVLVEQNGSRTVINEPFVLYDSDLAPYVGKQTEERRCLHVGGFHIRELMKTVLAIGSQGAMLSFQATGLPKSWQTAARLAELMAFFDVVFVNRDVAQEATGCRGGPAQLIEASVALTRSSSPKGIVVLTLGEDGVLLVLPDGDAPVHMPGLPAKVVDTTGAGDAFAGAFLAVWLSGGEVVEAARYGNAAGALIVSVEGAQGAIPTAASLAEMLSMAGPRPGERAATRRVRPSRIGARLARL